MENEFIKCKACGAELMEENNFCPNCGAKKENGFTKCDSCGAELMAADNFCPNCGAKRNGKKRKPLNKKLIVLLVLFIFLVIGVINIIGKDDVSDSTIPSRINAPVAQEPTTSIEPATDDKSMSRNETISSFAEIIEMTLLDYYSFAKVYANDTVIAIQVANDGLGDAVFEAKSLGLDANFEPWVEVRDSILDLYYSTYDLALSLGLDDIEISISVRDDQEHNKVFLVIVDGVVRYDYMAS